MFPFLFIPAEKKLVLKEKVLAFFFFFARPLRVKIPSTSTAFSASTPFSQFFLNATGALLES